MTVNSLIEELLKYRGDLTVVSDDDGIWYEVTNVSMNSSGEVVIG